MKKISAWAKANPWPARIIIILLHFILIVAAIYIGKNLSSISISISPVFNISAIVLYIAAVFCYPGKKDTKPHRWISHYAYHKSCDFILTFTGLFMICFLSNRPSNEFVRSNTLKGAYPASYNQPLTMISKKKLHEKPAAPYSFSGKERKSLMKELRSELKTLFKAKTSKGRKALLITLTVIGACILVTLLSALSCEIACSGNE